MRGDAPAIMAGALPRVAGLPGFPGRRPGHVKWSVRAFAYGEKAVYIETNVRTVFIHELSGSRFRFGQELRPLVEQTCPDERVRDWYYALLDWGARI